MGQISQFLRQGNGTIAHYCPACREVHAIAVHTQNPDTGGIWLWDMNIVEPTIHPSVCLDVFEKRKIIYRCHYTLEHGVLNYMQDCTHALKGIKVRLPPLPDWLKDRNFISIHA